MKMFLLAAGLLVISTAAFPETPPAAFAEEIMECVSGKVQLRSQILALQAQNGALQAQIDKFNAAGKATPEPAKPAPK